MFLRHRLQDGQVFIKVGLAFLAVFNIVTFTLRRNAVPETISDPVAGFLFGLAFGCIAVGMWRLRRRRPS